MNEIFLYLPQLMSGLSVTLLLMMTSIGIGLLLAILFTIASFSEITLIRKVIGGLIFFIRGTPLLVQIFLIYYGLGQFVWLRESIFWMILKEPTTCAIIAFSLNSACYTSVILQGAIRSLPQNEIAACHALGMPKWLAFRRIIFPRAFFLALPAYSNELTMILKGTSLASTITLLDIMGVTQQLISQTYDTVTFYLLAGVMYLLLNSIISGMVVLIKYFFKNYSPVINS